MGMTPVHPNLLLDRPLTRAELIEAVRYEGMFGYGPCDRVLVAALAAEGLVELGEVRGQPVVINCMDDPR